MSRSDRMPASPAPPSGCEAYSGLAQRGPASGPFRYACTGRGPGGSLRSTGRGRSTCSCRGNDLCSAGTPAETDGKQLIHVNDNNCATVHTQDGTHTFPGQYKAMLLCNTLN